MASLGSIYSRTSSRQFMDSFKEIGAFSHSYKATSGTRVGKHCRSYNDPEGSDDVHGITAVSIDTEGKHVASATLRGCITVHKFEELDSASQKFTSVTEDVDDQSKHLMHINVGYNIVQNIKWNPQNSEQMACTWNKLLVYDLNDVHHPTEYTFGQHVSDFDDLSFAPTTPLISSCYSSSVLIWDPRVGKTPQKVFSFKDGIMTCQFGKDDQTIFAAGYGGKVYGWDLRFYGLIGYSKPIWEPPLSMLKKPEFNLIRPFEEFCISSIHLNPSNLTQLAFNTANGWCGVLDTAGFQIKLSHAHPLVELPKPSSWLPKPSSWLGKSSIYAAPDGDKTLRLMDFHLSSESPCHMVSSAKMVAANPKLTHRDIVCSQSITFCAGHPLVNAIVVGTNRSSLMLITQKSSCEGFFLLAHHVHDGFDLSSRLIICHTRIILDMRFCMWTSCIELGDILIKKSWFNSP